MTDRVDHQVASTHGQADSTVGQMDDAVLFLSRVSNAVIGGAAMSVIIAAAGWRGGLLALLAAGAVAATRVRFATPVGVGLLAITAVLAAGGISGS